MDPKKKSDPDATDETSDGPLEDFDDESRDTDPPPYPDGDVIVLEDDGETD